MAAAAQRPRPGGGSTLDRLSALPEELLRHVLSFLPAQQVVRTTVLSKRWVDLWRSVPGINLDLTDFYRKDSNLRMSEVQKAAWERLEDFVTNLLVLHNAPCLDAFRLKANFVPHYSRRHLDAWIRRAIKDNPLVLQLLVRCFTADDAYYYYQLPNMGSSPCHRLKRLDLNGLYLEHSFAEKLQSWFPHLEDLILRACRQGFSVLQSDKLKNLDIKQSEYVSEDVFVIRAPALASLHLDIAYCYCKKGISLDAGKFLMKALVDMHISQWSPRSEVILLGILFSVANLELIGLQPEAVLHEEFDKLPIFNNLRTLSLGLRYDAHASKALGRFLQKSPNLENLALQNFKAMLVVELPSLKNLRTLVLYDCSLHDDFGLLRHCLQISPNLEKLTLKYCKLSEGSVGGEGKTKSKNTYSQPGNLVPLQCPKLKSTEIIYESYNGGHDNIPELVRFLLDSGCAPKNTITFSDMEELLSD